MLLLALLIVLLVAVVVRLATPPLRRLRMISELRGDWWTRFEHEFRAYDSHAWEAARDAERSA